MKEVTGALLVGERALYNSIDLSVVDSVFEDGESPLKECANILVDKCTFRWKYPLWYSSVIRVSGSTFEEGARAAIWYTRDIEITDTVIKAPKALRRCERVRLKNVTFTDAKETLWHCNRAELSGVRVYGDYFGMNCENIRATDLVIEGGYAFDGARNIEIRGARINSRDVFWNCENVTVYDSVIIGEYIGWNSKNVTLINCTVESNQGFCYMNNLTLRNCTLNKTDLAFEYSTVNADITGKIDSIKNPISGKIVADEIGEIIIDEDLVDKDKTEIILRK